MRKNNKKVVEEKEVKQKRRKQGKENAELLKGIEIANKATQKEKIKREKNKKKQEKERQKTQHKKKTVIKYILVLIIVMLSWLFLRYRHIVGITFSKEASEKNAIIIDTITSDNKIYPYQKEILVYSKGRIITYSRYGKKTWEHALDETFIPTISTSGKYIQVVNKDSGAIYVFNNKYESLRKKIDGTIKKANINSRGESVVHYSKEGAKSNIGIYDRKGNEKYVITLSTDNIAKVDISDNGKYLLFYEVNTEGISINSILKVVDFTQNEKVKTILELKNDVIYDIILKNSKVYVLTASKVYICDIKTNSKREFDINNKNISNISVDVTGSAYVDKKVTEQKSTLTIINGMYKQIGEHDIDGNIKELVYKNSIAYVISNREINIYNRWGIHIKKFTSDSTINNPVIFNCGKNIAIRYSNKIAVFGI